MSGSGACESYAAYESMCKHFLPLIDKHSRKMREDVHALEKGLDTVVSTQKEQFSEVFQFVQEAVLLWDNHKTAIEKIQRKHQVKTNTKCILSSYIARVIIITSVHNYVL